MNKKETNNDFVHYRYIQPRYGNYKDLILDKYFTIIEHKYLDRETIRKIMEEEISKHPEFSNRYCYTHRGFGEEYDNECLVEIAIYEIPRLRKIPLYRKNINIQEVKNEKAI